MAHGDKSRLDRELMELLNELRVALPGVQVLFAFLLTVPFASRFEAITMVQKRVFFMAFLLTALATAAMVAPTAFHRLRWRRYDKAWLLRTSNRLAITGLALLAAATSLVVYLIGDVLFETTFAVATAAGCAVVLGWLWFGLGLYRAAQNGEVTGEDDADDVREPGADDTEASQDAA